MLAVHELCAKHKLELIHNYMYIYMYTLTDTWVKGQSTQKRHIHVYRHLHRPARGGREDGGLGLSISCVRIKGGRRESE